MSAPLDHSAGSKARRRAFIRAHHPDRGGSADVFVAGLAAFEHGCADQPDTTWGGAPQASAAQERVVVTAYRKRGIHSTLRRWLPTRRHARPGTPRVR